MTTIYKNLTFAYIDYGDNVNYEYLNITGKLILKIKLDLNCSNLIYQNLQLKRL
jgi:hypothetical protein